MQYLPWTGRPAQRLLRGRAFLRRGRGVGRRSQNLLVTWKAVLVQQFRRRACTVVYNTRRD